jgi:hypothetical protein
MRHSGDPPGKGEGVPQPRSTPDTTPTSIHALPNNYESPSNNQERESRRGWATCFAANKTEDWQADFTGVTVLEDGQRFWVNVYKKLDKNNKRYVSVCLRPWKGKS